MEQRCAICERSIREHGKGRPIYFCWRCYKKWKKNIIDKEKWVTFLINEEQNRRRQEVRLIKLGITAPLYLSDSLLEEKWEGKRREQD
jgi:hypothetical protein